MTIVIVIVFIPMIGGFSHNIPHFQGISLIITGFFHDFPIIGGHLWIFLLQQPCFARDVRRDILPAAFCRRMGLQCHPMAGEAIERSAGLATTFVVHIPC